MVYWDFKNVRYLHMINISANLVAACACQSQ